MKIALVLDDTLDKPDGVQQYVLTLGSWLTKTGHDVYYLVADTKRTDLPNVVSLGRFLNARFNGNTVRTPLPSISGIRRAIRDIGPDIIHVQMPYSPFLGGRVIQAAAGTTGVVGTFHILPVSRSGHQLNRGLGLLLRPTLRRFDKIMAVSEPAGEFAKSAYGLTTTVVPNAIDASRYSSPRRKTSGNKILFLGRLVKRKGVLDLIKSYNLLPNEVAAKSRLVIAGAGPLLSSAQKLVSPSRTVEFKGYVEESDKPALLSAADLAVFPATGGESFGIILLEAMASGATVLGAKNPGYNSILSPIPESLFKPNDPKGLAILLEKLLTDSKLKEAVQKRQSQLVSEYDISVVGPKILSIYEAARALR